MKTYQDLLKAGANEKERGKFCFNAISEFKASPEYAIARDGEAYYNKHNITIEKFQKFLYTVSGRQVPDIFGANYKLKTLFFRRLVIQQVQYLLGNGLSLGEPENKKKLGKSFDFKLQSAAKMAMAGGRSFGFWNLDHLEVFGFADTPSHPGFCPLYDDNTSELCAGIRFWQRRIGENMTYWCTLYEEDGYTEYSKKGNKEIKVTTPKKAYKTTMLSTLAGGVEKEIEENYGRLPIVQLFANDTHESELVGIRESIDCYDFIKSGLANAIDDTAEIYWVIKNSGGMEDPDIAKFLQRLKTMHGAAYDGTGDSEVTANTVDVPVEARRTMIELLRNDIYEDFQALDVRTLSAAAKTTQEIQAAYQAQDNKCDDFEYYLLEFVDNILELAGIEDNPTFERNRIINQNEQTQMVLSAANYLPEEILLNKLPWLTPEEVAIALQELDKQGYQAFNDEE